MVNGKLNANQKAVQACHACLESSKNNPYKKDHPHLVLLECSDERELAEIASMIRDLWHPDSFPVIISEFREPDMDDLLTAAAFSNVQGKNRSYFSFLPLVKFGEQK